MENYDISVVLGSFNRKSLIKATIDSVRKNIFQGTIEIIVIDGGSTDGTCDWLSRQHDIFTLLQPNYTIINKYGIKVKAHSWGNFMNIAFRYAHSKYIVMISDDLILAPDCLQKGFDEMEKRISNGEKIGAGAFYFREYPRHDYYRVGTIGPYIALNHGFYLKDALEDVNYIDEESFNFYYGDTDLIMRLNNAGWKSIDLHECFALHLNHMPSRKKSVPQRFMKDKEMFKKRYPNLEEIPSLKIDLSKKVIDTKPFIRHAFSNVVIGFLMRYCDKKRKKNRTDF